MCRLCFCGRPFATTQGLLCNLRPVVSAGQTCGLAARLFVPEDIGRFGRALGDTLYNIIYKEVIMLAALNKIRRPGSLPRQKKTINSILIFALGVALGVISKVLDETASNLLPPFIERLDLANFFSRMGVWLFIGICISVFSKTPLRAALNVLLFFVGMVGSYYLYTVIYAGFYPKAYMMIWVALTLASPFFAAVCWYAKGTHVVSVVLSAFLAALMMRQAFAFGFWYFDVRNILELILLILTFAVLYKEPKQIALVVLLGAALFFLTANINLFGGLV